MDPDGRRCKFAPCMESEGILMTFWLLQDILRGQYQMLSADPNSLANLDQGKLCPIGRGALLTQSKDLPNNLQREVPIVSR